MADPRMTRIKRLLTIFETDCGELAFKGARHPDDWEGIEEQYRHSKSRLLKAIEEAINEGSKEGN